jgi:hypothetical protein
MTVREIITDHFARYTVAYIAAAGYALMASMGAFIDIFSALTREQAEALPWWGVLALIAKAIVPGIAAILAFLNQSVSKARLASPSVPAKP